MLSKFDGIKKNELSMIEVAHALLEKKGSLMDFNELLIAVQDYLALSEEELDKKMSTFYTELNTDGSFISPGENRWGLRTWYKVDELNKDFVSAFEDETMSRTTNDDEDLDYNNDDPEDRENIIDKNRNDNEEDDYNEDFTEYDADLNSLETDEDELDSSIEEDLTIVSDEEAFDEDL